MVKSAIASVWVAEVETEIIGGNAIGGGKRSEINRDRIPGGIHSLYCGDKGGRRVGGTIVVENDFKVTERGCFREREVFIIRHTGRVTRLC